MRRLLLALAATLALAGCQGDGGGTPTPSDTVSVATSATPATATTQATSAAPAPSPTVDTSSLPSASGWSPRPQTVDEEAASPDVAWASERDVEEIMEIWASYACTQRSALPTPRKVVEGAFDTPEGAAAVVEVVTFSDDADAAAFRKDYLGGSLSCGASRISDDAISRPIDADTWTEIVTVDGATAQVVVVQQELDADAVAAVIEELG